MGQIIEWRGRLGTLLKYSGFIFDLGHREPLKILNKDYVLHVKKGLCPTPQLKAGRLVWKLLLDSCETLRPGSNGGQVEKACPGAKAGPPLPHFMLPLLHGHEHYTCKQPLWGFWDRYPSLVQSLGKFYCS